MFLAAVVGGVNVGDILFSIVSLLVVIVVIFLIIRLFSRSNNRNKDLTRIEEKLDTLKKDKDKL